MASKYFQKMRRLFYKGKTPKEIARSLKVSPSIVSLHIDAWNQGFDNFDEYEECLAEEKGFNNIYEYRRHLRRQERAKRSPNKKFRKLIRRTLEREGKTQTDMAREIGVSREMVSQYAQGYSIPRGDKRDKVAEFLGLKRKSLDRLLSE